MRERRLDWRLVGTIARHEARVALRSRWLEFYTALLALLNLAVSYFGLAVIEFTGFQSFDRTAVSMLNMLLYLVPLAAMLMAVQSFRPEGGATDQFFAEPVTAAEVVLGKAGGLVAVHSLAVIIGFALAGILIGAKAGLAGVGAYLALLALILLLGASFIGLGTLLAVLSGRGPRSYAAALAAWFALVLLFDLLVIGLGFLLPEAWANRAALAAVFLNPVDAARVAAMLLVSGRELFGAAGALLLRTLGSADAAVSLLLAALTAWIAATLAAASRVLGRQDIAR